VHDILLNNGETLTLSGGPNDVFIFNVHGDLELNGNSRIVLDGVAAAHVLWNFPSATSHNGGSDHGGDNIEGDANAVLFGTILAPDRSVKWEGTINGALIAGGRQIDLDGGSSGGCDGHRGHSDGDSDGGSDGGGDCSHRATINYIPWAFGKPDELAAPPAPGISGSVYEDSNGDGIRSAADLGVEGVTIELRDAATNAVVASTVTDADGNYHFGDPGNGTYKLVEIQPAGLLDGAETVGSNGGTVNNTTDGDVIDQIVYTSGATASGYNFGEVEPGGLSGFVWEDANQDGQINFGEQALPGVVIHLTGTDDRGNPVNLSTTTDAQGLYTFVNLRPGEYALSEEQPAGFADGLEVAGTLGGVVDATPGADQISEINVGSRLIGSNYNFGEQAASTGQVQAGQTANIGFWKGKDGTKLIRELNGSSKSVLLGDYLAATYPNLFGNLAGMTNDQVNSYYSKLFKDKVTQSKKSVTTDARKLEVEVMALALATYVTDQNLVELKYDKSSVDHIARDTSGNVLADASLAARVRGYGFLVTGAGVGAATYNVGTLYINHTYTEANVRAAFNLSASDSTVLRISDILRATNDLTSSGGDLYDLMGDGLSSLEKMMRDIANDVYTAINQSGGIS
jgi:hypothetical protein